MYYFWGVNTSEESAVLKHDSMTLKSQIVEVAGETELKFIQLTLGFVSFFELLEKCFNYK